MSNNEEKKSSIGKVIFWLGAISSCIAIFVFITGYQSIVDFFEKSPTSIPVIVVTVNVSQPTAIPPTTAPSLPQTVTVYTQRTDGEVLSLWCNSDWDMCRNAPVSNGMWEGLQVTTIGTGYNEKGEFIIERAFLFFDTSQIPSNATVTGATLHLYSGQWQNGNKSIHVVRSYAEIPLSTSDYSRIEFISGGYVTFGNPLEWEKISLSTPALGWIVKGGNTKLALIHDNDLKNIAPSEAANDVLIATAEDQPHAPYLVINYVSP